MICVKLLYPTAVCQRRNSSVCVEKYSDKRAALSLNLSSNFLEFKILMSDHPNHTVYEFDFRLLDR